MSDYINKVILKGRPGEVPPLRFLPSGDAVLNFSLATPSGNNVEWHRIVVYKKLAERAKAQIGTGDLVYLEGEIKTREMVTSEDKALGRKGRKITEIIVDVLHLVEKKGSGAPKAVDAEPNASFFDVQDVDDTVAGIGANASDIPQFL